MNPIFNRFCVTVGQPLASPSPTHLRHSPGHDENDALDHPLSSSPGSPGPRLGRLTSPGVSPLGPRCGSTPSFAPSFDLWGHVGAGGHPGVPGRDSTLLTTSGGVMLSPTTTPASYALFQLKQQSEKKQQNQQSQQQPSCQQPISAKPSPNCPSSPSTPASSRGSANPSHHESPLDLSAASPTPEVTSPRGDADAALLQSLKASVAGNPSSLDASTGKISSAILRGNFFAHEFLQGYHFFFFLKGNHIDEPFSFIKQNSWNENFIMNLTPELT
jgi:hypothetical protein